MENKICKEYINQLKRTIPNDVKDKEQFIQSISLDVNIFLDENPEATETDIYLEFGTPEELANSLVSDCGQINDFYLKQKKMKTWIGLLSGAVVMVLFFMFIIVPHIGVKVNQEVYIYEGTELIEEEEDN